MSSQIRADASLNRETLLAVATRVFAQSDGEPSLRAIAREAGVGIGTLYRHFPKREALVEAIYIDQLQKLTAGASKLLSEFPPAEAMRRWMDLFGQWIATKHGMADSLRTMVAAGEISQAETRAELVVAIETILATGRAAGDIRNDAAAEDVAAMLVGVFVVAGSPDQAGRASRLLDILMDGLRPGANSVTETP